VKRRLQEGCAVVIPMQDERSAPFAFGKRRFHSSVHARDSWLQALALLEAQRALRETLKLFDIKIRSAGGSERDWGRRLSHRNADRGRFPRHWP
jgi:hypothetical protein